MFIGLYIPATVLPYGLMYGSARLRVPAELYTYMGGALAAGDWTYFRIRQRNRTEIIKIIGREAPDSLVILRAGDNTEDQSFTAGAVLDYVDTVAAVLDSYAPPALVLDPLLAIEVTGKVIGYQDITIKALGATEIVGDDANIIIGRKENAYGACRIKNLPAPLPTP